MCARADGSDACCACCPAYVYANGAGFATLRRPYAAVEILQAARSRATAAKPENSGAGAHAERTDAGGCLGPGNAETVASALATFPNPGTRQLGLPHLSRANGSLPSLDSILMATKACRCLSTAKRTPIPTPCVASHARSQVCW
jgi:hypothetical protein